MKVGVFGSALNPMTMGHVDAIKQALESCDHVLVVPSYSHAFGKQMKPFEFRLSLAQSVVAEEFNCGRVSVSDIESKIYDGIRPVYTYDLLKELSLLDDNNEYVFLCGTDNVEVIHDFHMGQEIMQRWGIVELFERKSIRSTLVREMVLSGQSITNLVSPSIEDLVITNYKI